MTITTIATLDDGIAVVLTPEVQAKLNLEAGDRICLVDTPRGVELVPLSAEAAAQLEVGRQVMKDSEEALRELAK